jgi:hypothetical protein
MGHVPDPTGSVFMTKEAIFTLMYFVLRSVVFRYKDMSLGRTQVRVSQSPLLGFRQSEKSIGEGPMVLQGFV